MEEEETRGTQEGRGYGGDTLGCVPLSALYHLTDLILTVSTTILKNSTANVTQP